MKSEYIYSIFKALNSVPQTIHDDSRDSSSGDTYSTPPDEEHDQHMNTIIYFSELPIEEEEEEEYKAIFYLQHYSNMRRRGQTLQDIPPWTSTSTAGKEATPKEKVIPELEYDLVDDLKKAKENISLFELLKIP